MPPSLNCAGHQKNKINHILVNTTSVSLLEENVNLEEAASGWTDRRVVGGLEAELNPGLLVFHAATQESARVTPRTNIKKEGN